MLRALFVLLAITLSLPALAQGWIGTWTSPMFAIQLNQDATFAWQDSTQVLQGQYQIQGGILTLLTPAGTAVYGIIQQGDALQLTDPYGQRVVLQRYGAQAVQAVPQVTVPQGSYSRAPADGQGMSQQELLAFLESYPQLPPDEVYARWARVNQDQRLLLSSTVTNHIYVIMCSGTHADTIVYEGKGCPALYADVQLALQAGSDVQGYWETERMQAVTMLQCSMGLIDAASCGTYNGVQSNINAMQHDTNMQIINNMGNQGCTEYYNQDNQYLGCW